MWTRAQVEEQTRDVWHVNRLVELIVENGGILWQDAEAVTASDSSHYTDPGQ